MILTVKKYRHYCNWFWSFLFPTCRRKFKFKIKLGDGWNYEYRNQDDFDTSKLFRLSDNWHHTQDSVGLGVNKKQDGSLYFRTIVHRNRQILTKEICEAKTGKWYDCEIWIGEENYYVKVGNITKATKRNSSYNGLRYTLGSMAGGDLKAAKDLKVRIEYK